MGTPYLRYLVKGRKQHAATTNDQTERHTKTTHDRRPFCSLGHAETKSARQKRRGQIPSPRTICREQSDGTLPRKRHHRIRKRESVHQDKSTTGSATEFHFQVVYGHERRIKKVAHFVPLSCFHWHISCHFRTFDDITETPGPAWAITESDSSFPLCSLNLFLDKIRIKKYRTPKKRGA